jgi:hypothetical protein
MLQLLALQILLAQPQARLLPQQSVQVRQRQEQLVQEQVALAAIQRLLRQRRV